MGGGFPVDQRKDREVHTRKWRGGCCIPSSDWWLIARGAGKVPPPLSLSWLTLDLFHTEYSSKKAFTDGKQSVNFMFICSASSPPPLPHPLTRSWKGFRRKSRIFWKNFQGEMLNYDNRILEKEIEESWKAFLFFIFHYYYYHYSFSNKGKRMSKERILSVVTRFALWRWS